MSGVSGIGLTAGYCAEQTIAPFGFAENAEVRGCDHIHLAGQRKQRRRRARLPFQFDLAERRLAIGCNDLSDIHSDLDRGLALRHIPAMPFDMDLKHRRQPSVAHAEQIPDLRLVENRCVVCDRALPFLAGERSGRDTVADLDGLNPFVSRLPDAQRQAAPGQLPSGGVEIDRLLQQDGGRRLERMLLQQRCRCRL